MGELIFLGIAGAAAVFKLFAIVVGVMWAFHSLLSVHGIPLSYRYTCAELPFRSSYKRY